MNRSHYKLLLAAIGVAVLAPLNARAAVTNVVWYRLGENDPGAVAGGAAASTRDVVGSVNLPLNAGPHYSADVASAAAHAGSSLSMQFSTGQWGTNAVIPNIVDNFGLELWVKISTVATNIILAYNGHTATSGWGLIQVGTNYQGLFGGRVFFGSGMATPNVWTHVALVRDNGLSTLYVNGVVAGTSPATPGSPTGRFGIGAPPQNPVTDFLNGSLDEVRVFTFAPGQFSTNDLLLKQATNHSFVVTTLADSGPGSLRSLIDNALDGDEITFATNGTITLTSGELQITKSLMVNGPGTTNLSVSGNNSSRVFNVVSSNAAVALAFMTIRDGRAGSSAHGGGVYNAGNLVLNSCALTGNAAGDGPGGGGGASGGTGGSGGALYNAGSVWLSSCTLDHNRGGGGGRGGAGSISPFGGGNLSGPGGYGGNGGAIYNAGQARIVQCTIGSNAPGNGGVGGSDLIGPGGNGGPGGSGGGIFNAGAVDMVASTIAMNNTSAGGAGGTGGGGANGGSGPGGSGGGILNFDLGSATAINTIVAGNSGNSPDLAGVFSSLGHNLIGQADVSNGFANGVNGDLTGSLGQPLDPKLAPLGDYGGQSLTRTLTFALQAGSPALNAGDDAVLSPPYSLTGDQRSLPRKFGAHVDIGSFESQVVFSNAIVTTLPVTPVQDPIFGGWTATLQGMVNPGGYPSTVYFQYGITAAYGGVAPAGTLPAFNFSNNPVSASISNLLDSRTYHYRAVATNSAGIFVGADRTFSTALVQPVLGDLNGDGIVDQSELFLVQSNYFRTSPWLLMTNVAGLGGTNVTFALPDSTAGSFTVEYSTSLSTWLPLGPATPRYLFTDTNAPASPQRSYRLRWP